MVWTLPTSVAMASTVTRRSWVMSPSISWMMSLVIWCGVPDHASLANNTRPSWSACAVLWPLQSTCSVHCTLVTFFDECPFPYFFHCQKTNNTSMLFFRCLHFTVSLHTTWMTMLEDWRMLLLAFSHMTCTHDPLAVGSKLPRSCRNHSLLHMQRYCHRFAHSRVQLIPFWMPLIYREIRISVDSNSGDLTVHCWHACGQEGWVWDCGDTATHICNLVILFNSHNY